MNNTGTFLLVSKRTQLEDRLSLPDEKDNLFICTICDPTKTDRVGREESCTASLRNLLVHSPVFEKTFLKWLRQLSKQTQIKINNLRWTYHLERAITGGKRIDLAIEGRTESNDELKVLWILEIKAQARHFHESGDISLEGEEDTVDVSQINNYDHWLNQQEAKYKHGFAISCDSLKKELPDNLNNSWHCTTWTKVGEQISTLLEANSELSEKGEFLLEHFLGFIIKYLWRASEMEEQNLEFNDIALMKAFSEIGKQCQNKLDVIVKGFERIFEEENVGYGEVNKWGQFFKTPNETLFTRYRRLNSKGKAWVWLYTGIYNSTVSVFIASNIEPQEQKKKVTSVLKEQYDELKHRTQLGGYWDRGPGGYNVQRDLTYSVPLENILASPNQGDCIIEVVRFAIRHLKTFGIIEQLNTIDQK